MKHVGRGTVMNATNPHLVFAAQVDGFLVDPVALDFAIYDATNDAKLLRPELITSGSLDVTLPSADRLGVGRYACSWTVLDAEPEGKHQVVWTYQLVLAGPSYTHTEVFDVVDGIGVYAAGPFYCALSDMRDEGVDMVDMSDARVLAAIQRASLFIERNTRRFFEPRFMNYRMSGAGHGLLRLNDAVIGIEDLKFISPYTVHVPRYSDAASVYRVYNRHLRGLLSPDDRSNPKIELFQFNSEPFGWDVQFFPRGTQNVEVTGLFGFTEPDGGPLGQTPPDIALATKLLVARDVGRIGGRCQDKRFEVRMRGRITMERTRDQSITYDGAKAAGLYAGITGDAEIDEILAAFRGPLALGAA